MRQKEILPPQLRLGNKLKISELPSFSFPSGTKSGIFKHGLDDVVSPVNSKYYLNDFAFTYELYRMVAYLRMHQGNAHIFLFFHWVPYFFRHQACGYDTNSDDKAKNKLLHRPYSFT